LNNKSAIMQYSYWEYDPEKRAVVEPLSAIVQWVSDLLSASSLRYDQCLLIKTEPRSTSVQELLPCTNSHQQRWLMSALTGSNSLLMILGCSSLPFHEAFVQMEPMPGDKHLEKMPWCVHAEAAPDLVVRLERAGGGVVFGHDGQYMLICERTGTDKVYNIFSD
jgi:hypothetical protein